ncbi:hypothetical protein DEQ92_21615, partial [Haloferax sp. Atlit-6N]
MQSGSRSRRADVEEAELCQTDVYGTVRKEFKSAEFGDERLTDRLMQSEIGSGHLPSRSLTPARTGPPQRLHTDFAMTSVWIRSEILDAHK